MKQAQTAEITCIGLLEQGINHCSSNSSPSPLFPVAKIIVMIPRPSQEAAQKGGQMLSHLPSSWRRPSKFPRNDNFSPLLPPRFWGWQVHTVGGGISIGIPIQGRLEPKRALCASGRVPWKVGVGEPPRSKLWRALIGEIGDFFFQGPMGLLYLETPGIGRCLVGLILTSCGHWTVIIIPHECAQSNGGRVRDKSIIIRCFCRGDYQEM